MLEKSDFDGSTPVSLDADVAVEEVLHDHHRVVALFDGLTVKAFRQLRKVGLVEPDGRREVLVFGVEFVANLILQQGMELRVMAFVGSRHTATLSLVKGTVIQGGPN